jgi:signal transduction histidine kinase
LVLIAVSPFVEDGPIDRHVSSEHVIGTKALRKRFVRRAVMDTDAIRARALVEESREAVVVVDEDDRVLFASRRARQSVDGIREGQPLPPDLLSGGLGVIPFVVPYDVDGRSERLVYFSQAGDLIAYEELRSGFTAAVSHELRTPLARLLTLLETATLPGEDVDALIAHATSEVEQITELIDEVLFLSELESGARVVSLGATPARHVLEQALDELAERAARAGVALRVEGDSDIELAVRPRMLRVVARNLAENAIRYAGPESTFTLSLERQPDGAIVLSGKDDGVGVGEAELPRLFERFYRSDRARASRGTGLGLAIVKHVVAQAGGTVEARPAVPRGLEIHCIFP